MGKTLHVGIILLVIFICCTGFILFVSLMKNNPGNEDRIPESRPSTEQTMLSDRGKPCKSNEEWHMKADEKGFWSGGILVSDSMTDEAVFSMLARYNISSKETTQITGPHFLGYYLTVNESQNESLVDSIRKSRSGWNVSFSSPMYAFFPPGIKARNGRIETPIFLIYTEKMNETMVFDNLISRDIPLRKARVVRLGYFPLLDAAGKEKIFRDLNHDPDVLFAFKEYLEGDIC